MTQPAVKKQTTETREKRGFFNFGKKAKATPQLVETASRPAWLAPIGAEKLKHVAIIMDGNGRWAKANGKRRAEGHRAGVEAARRAIQAAKELELECLTLYSFSTENWNRPQDEVNHLMGLIKEFIGRDLLRLHDENVRVKIIGDKINLPEDIKGIIQNAEDKTADNTGYLLQVAFNYGGRDELIRATKQIAQLVADGKLNPSDISEDTIVAALDTGNAPDPDLVIRTSGEYRTSNFLVWQAAYAEFVFLDALWPDFDADLFKLAAESYYGRDRRYGATEDE